MIASTQTNHPLAGGQADARAPSALELATTKLKAAGLRITQPRIAILAALNKCEKPVSIELLHAELGSAACDLVTVYRCMAAFEEIGLVRRAFFHNGTTLYALSLDKTKRYHVVCKETNRVEEIDAETSADLKTSIERVEEVLRTRGYADVGHIVEFFGTAPKESRTAAPSKVGAVPPATR